MSNDSHYRSKLVQKRDELADRLERVDKSQRKVHDRDFDEQALERENDEIVDALSESIRKELEQVERAISRIDNGKYNVCSKCNGEISYSRLEALPYTELCIQCASG